jgi:hypothetical protein
MSRKLLLTTAPIEQAISRPRPVGAAMAADATNIIDPKQTFLAHGTILHTTGEALSVV